MKPVINKCFVFICFVLLVQIACKRVADPISVTGDCIPTKITVEFLGFEDKFALRMVLEEPYLYVCAGSNGVWKRDIRSMSEWQYLGLRDTSLGDYTNVGAVDIDVLNNDIMVAYNGSAPHVDPESTVSVWRSKNGGIDWFRSDSGIPESIADPFESNILSSLQRSTHNPNIVIGWIDPTCYISTNGGSQWNMLFGQRGVISGGGYIRWHPFQPGEFWIFGEAGLFYPYCFSMQNYGLEPKTHVNFDSLGFPADGAVYDIAFDAGNPDVIYAATSQGVIKTIDGGYTWYKNAVKIPDNGFVFQMAHHPSFGSILYLAGGKEVYATCDSGKKVQSIREIERGFITSLVFDAKGKQLFVGTTEGGVYTIKLNGR